MGLTKYNVSLDGGFKRESETLAGMSANARTTFQHILDISDGDLSKTAKILDDILNETQIKIKKLTEEDELTDEEFYERLSFLRSEHKDTLDIIERLYKRSSHTPCGLKAEIGDQNERENNTRICCVSQANEFPYLPNPPTDTEYSKSVESPTERITKLELSRAFQPNAASFPKQSDKLRNEDLKGETKPSHEEYIQPLDLTGLHDQKSEIELESPKNSTWRHHITVPKPFKMCEREQRMLQRNRRSRSMQHLLSEREANESELTGTRLAGQFRAKPIPAHVYLPLYEHLVEQQAERREAIRAHRKEMLKATEKPFKFTIREQQRKERGELVDEAEAHRRSLSLMRQSSSADQRKLRKDRCRDTMDLPDHLYENRMERIHEDQLLREVKRQLRAQRLLQSASLPAGMEERERRAAKRRADRANREKKRGLDPDLELQQRAAKPFRAKPAPDFKTIHWKTDQSLRRIWRPPPDPTRPKPFNLHTSKRSRSATDKQDKSTFTGSESADGTVDRKQRSSSKKPAPKPGDFRRSLAEIPSPAKAYSSMLRENHVRQSMEKARLEAKKAEEAEQARRAKQAEVSRLMRDSACYLGDQVVSPKQLVAAVTENRKRMLMKEDSARRAEYQRELEEMRKRVASRPLLITRQSQVIARQRAENQFANTLRQAGLDPQEVIASACEVPETKDTGQPAAGQPYEDYDPTNHFGDEQPVHLL